MAFRAVLDANVLYPNVLRDALLTMAEAELFVPVWSRQIQDEAVRNLIADHRISMSRGARFVAAMDAAFPEAMVDPAAIAELTPAMTNHPGDRHVLATAVSGDAHRIITENVKHFPPSACSHYGVEAVKADWFLTTLLSTNPRATVDALVRQSNRLKSPPISAKGILDSLAALGCTDFADAARDMFP